MRWLTSLHGALGLAMLGGIALAGAAQPVPVSNTEDVSVTAFSDCPAGWFCAWEHAGGTGRLVRTQGSIGDLGYMDNQISSLWNRTGVSWCAYDTDFTGPILALGDIQVPDLRGQGWDNRISSLQRGCR